MAQFEFSLINLGELASTKWRLRFARRKGEEALGAVDPTGSYCAMPDDWIKKKLAAAAVRPTNSELFRSEPFISFVWNVLMTLN